VLGSRGRSTPAAAFLGSLLSFTASSSIDVSRSYACRIRDGDSPSVRIAVTHAATPACVTFASGTVSHVGRTRVRSSDS
jgi:hypothetical protein